MGPVVVAVVGHIVKENITHIFLICADVVANIGIANNDTKLYYLKLYYLQVTYILVEQLDT